MKCIGASYKPSTNLKIIIHTYMTHSTTVIIHPPNFNIVLLQMDHKCMNMEPIISF